MKGAITQHIDLAQIVLYAFWGFFAYLIYYLCQENKREGYPLDYERPDTAPYTNFPPIPAPKTFILPHGGTAVAPRKEGPQPEIHAQPIAPWPGAPLEPTGDAMVSGAGPGAYALRSDTPDLTMEGHPKIVPLRVASSGVGHYKQFTINREDADPRGMTVVGADGTSAGVVADVWVDVQEVIIRYLEVQPKGASSNVLVPINFTRIDGRKGVVNVKAILSSQFAGAPATKEADKVTFREEDRISAYFGAGTLYATPRRREAWL